MPFIEPVIINVLSYFHQIQRWSVSVILMQVDKIFSLASNIYKNINLFYFHAERKQNSESYEIYRVHFSKCKATTRILRPYANTAVTLICDYRVLITNILCSR